MFVVIVRRGLNCVLEIVYLILPILSYSVCIRCPVSISTFYFHLLFSFGRGSLCLTVGLFWDGGYTIVNPQQKDTKSAKTEPRMKKTTECLTFSTLGSGQSTTTLLPFFFS